MRQIISTLGAFLLLMGSIPTALGRMQFLSPPEFSERRNAQRNTVWTMGAPIELRWTPGVQGKALSVMLYQLTAEEAATFDGEFDYTQSDGAEFITRMSHRSFSRCFLFLFLFLFLFSCSLFL